MRRMRGFGLALAALAAGCNVLFPLNERAPGEAGPPLVDAVFADANDSEPRFSGFSVIGTPFAGENSVSADGMVVCPAHPGGQLHAAMTGAHGRFGAIADANCDGATIQVSTVYIPPDRFVKDSLNARASFEADLVSGNDTSGAVDVNQHFGRFDLAHLTNPPNTDAVTTGAGVAVLVDTGTGDAGRLTQIDVAVAMAGTLHLGIYDSNANGTLPTNLISDLGSLTFTSAAVTALQTKLVDHGVPLKFWVAVLVDAPSDWPTDLPLTTALGFSTGASGGNSFPDPFPTSPPPVSTNRDWGIDVVVAPQ